PELAAVEIRHLAGADMVEMQDVEIGLDVAFDRGIGEMHLMHAPATRAALQAPHDGEALAVAGRALEILADVEETVEIPVEVIEPVLAERRGGGGRRRGGGQRQSNNRTAGEHRGSPLSDRAEHG